MSDLDLSGSLDTLGRLLFDELVLVCIIFGAGEGHPLTPSLLLSMSYDRNV
jgi:hypothetical protein